MAIHELAVKHLTLPFASATSICYKTDAFPLPSDVYRIYSTFLDYYAAWPCDLDCHVVALCQWQYSSVCGVGVAYSLSGV